MKYLKDVMYYESKLDLLETEIAIKFVKDNFEKKLEKLTQNIQAEKRIDQALDTFINGICATFCYS